MVPPFPLQDKVWCQSRCPHSLCPLRVVGPSPPSQKPHGALHAPHPDTHTHITHRWYSSVLWFFSWFFFWVGWLKGGRRQSLTEVGWGRLAGPPP